MVDKQIDSLYEAGYIYYEKRHFNSSMLLLENLVKKDSDNCLSGSSYAILSDIYLMRGETDRAETAARKALSISNSAFVNYLANNVFEELQKQKSTILTQPRWVMLEKETIVYYFHDTLGKSTAVNRYITEHQKAFDKVNSIFHAKLPKKIALFVWNDPQMAYALMGRPLAFSRMSTCVINALWNSSSGHELTHILAYWACDDKKSHRRFINEGVAVAFDQRKKSKIERAKQVAKNTSYITVLDFWENDSLWEESLLYPIAGAFVTYLYGRSSLNQFRELICDQTIHGAKKIYGVTHFQELVQDFDNIMKTSE